MPETRTRESKDKRDIRWQRRSVAAQKAALVLSQKAFGSGKNSPKQQLHLCSLFFFLALTFPAAEATSQLFSPLILANISSMARHKSK
jgi:hypothetical protein